MDFSLRNNLGRAARWSALALVTVMLLANCSKKDVKQDEPGFQTGDDTGAAAPTDTTAGTPTGAGEAGAASSELETVYFAYDSYSLNSTARGVLKASAQWLKDNSSATAQIEGHCDERGTTEYNLALGERRANAAKDYLVRLGVDAGRLSIISYGEERPQDSGHDESAWSKNRRAAFVLLSK